MPALLIKTIRKWSYPSDGRISEFAVPRLMGVPFVFALLANEDGAHMDIVSAMFLFDVRGTAFRARFRGLAAEAAGNGFQLLVG